MTKYRELWRTIIFRKKKNVKMQSIALLGTFQDLKNKHTIIFKTSVSWTGSWALEESPHAHTQMKPTLQNKATFYPWGECT